MYRLWYERGRCVYSMLIRTGPVLNLVRYCSNVSYELHKTFKHSNSYEVIFLADVDIDGRKMKLRMPCEFEVDNIESALNMVYHKRTTMFLDTFRALERKIVKDRENKNIKQIITETLEVLCNEV